MNDEKYWRSLREQQDPGAVKDLKDHEFMKGAAEPLAPSELSPISRKQFLALVTASAAFAAAGCTNYRDKGEIVPYTKKPEEITPGKANLYASTCTSCSQACGILVKTREGRPVKLDGNPDHPVNKGGSCATGQAAVMGLYEPARLRGPHTGAAAARTGDVTWEQVDADAVQHLAGCVRDGKEILLMSPPLTSPTAEKVLADFRAAFPQTRVIVYDRLHQETRRSAWSACYGETALPAVAWDKATLIVTLEADILGTEGFTVEQTRAFAASRDILSSNSFVRLYAVEGNMSLTGSNADYRLRLTPAAQREFVVALTRAVAARLNIAAGPLPAGPDLAKVAETRGLSRKVLERLVDDLAAHHGKGIVYAGSALGTDVHIAVNYLNELLGNTALYVAGEPGSGMSVSSASEVAATIAAMKGGRVGFVAHLDVNPLYHLPPGMGYAEALKSVPFTVAMTSEENETSQLCTYVLPIHTMLECWGDHSVRAGVHSLQQPVVAPLHSTRQKEAILLHWLSASKPFSESLYHEYLMRHWETVLYPQLGRTTDFRSFWLAALHDGVVIASARPRAPQPFQRTALAALDRQGTHASYAVLALPAPYIGDGTWANIGWLQELPHPVSKIVWDNYAAVSPATARALGVESNDLVEVSTGAGKATLPVFVQPGTADNMICVSLGYGRRNGGPVGSGIGVDITPLLSPASLSEQRWFFASSVAKVEGTRALVSTQEHHSLDDAFVKDLHLKRKIIREGSLQEYRDNPDALGIERKEYESISPRVEFQGVKWGMAIDLNKCTGCNACVAGCNVENNIPVVGKDQVELGREMQWIRIDRYYSGTPDEPVASHQPMLCQHCDNAPCENVCPVVATNHSPDGLNQMVYNRCVGTKYCSNNCPYKVRRFNFLDFRYELADGYYDQEPVSLMHNPEVTVRSRGVMEKCTFCVQRIMEARQHATERGVVFDGKEVQTACQQACPAQAIVFGNVHDPEAGVVRYREHKLGYDVLGELNVRPNVTYLARLRNIHSEKRA
ncbi:MAG: molybdopterin oxidoreductase, iron-sulfur binding subunit [Bacteroidetes bacterium]|nr:molybdopterin oxidoreductase, iron-sulfur binding subunit [Bacteroidota bacterium]